MSIWGHECRLKMVAIARCSCSLGGAAAVATEPRRRARDHARGARHGVLSRRRPATRRTRRSRSRPANRSASCSATRTAASRTTSRSGFELAIDRRLERAERRDVRRPLDAGTLRVRLPAACADDARHTARHAVSRLGASLDHLHARRQAAVTCGGSSPPSPTATTSSPAALVRPGSALEAAADPTGRAARGSRARPGVRNR